MSFALSILGTVIGGVIIHIICKLLDSAFDNDQHRD